MDDVKLLTKILKKYVGIKMFQEEQDKFKNEFFEALFEPSIPIDYSTRSTLFINTILEEDNLPFLFLCKRESVGNNRNKIYWEIIDLNK